LSTHFNESAKFKLRIYKVLSPEMDIEKCACVYFSNFSMWQMTPKERSILKLKYIISVGRNIVGPPLGKNPGKSEIIRVLNPSILVEISDEDLFLEHSFTYYVRASKKYPGKF